MTTCTRAPPVGGLLASACPPCASATARTPGFRHNDFEAGFSPDGRQVVFASDRRYADSCCTDLFVMDANGAHLRLLKSSGSRVLLFPSWQPLP